MALNQKRLNSGVVVGLTAAILGVAIVGGAYWYMAGSAPLLPIENAVESENEMAGTANVIPPVTTGDVKIGVDPYTLTDMNGKTVTEKSFPDKFKLVFFGFTHCTDACPIAMQTMTRTLANLGADAARVQPLFISVDPKRDTGKVMQDYLKNFSPAILGLTGTPAQIQAVQASFKVYASDGKVEVADGDEAVEDAHQHQDDGTGDPDIVNHSDNIFLLKPGNGFVNVFNGDVDANTLTAGLKAAMAEPAKP